MTDIVKLIVGEDKVPYEGWTDINIKKSLENLCGEFSIGMTQLFNADDSIPDYIIQRGDKCILEINNKPIITGFADTVKKSYNSTSHIIEVTGRDKTSDLVDGSLIGNADLLAPYTPKQLIEHALSIIGITDIKVIDKTNVVIKYEEDFNASAGKNIWVQLDKYLQKKSIFATVDAYGNIVFFRGSFGNTNQALFHFRSTNPNNNLNNIKSGMQIDSENERFNKIIILSQSLSLSSDGIFYEQGGSSYSAIDQTVRNTRQLEIIANANLTSDECQDLADFQKNIRQARGTTHNFVIQGFTQSNGDLWLPNYQVYIKDEFLNIDDYFLIKSINMTKNNSNGTITTLEVVDKLAYTLREPITITNTTEVLFPV